MFLVIFIVLLPGGNRNTNRGVAKEKMNAYSSLDVSGNQTLGSRSNFCYFA
jgi:hypothetical protein